MKVRLTISLVVVLMPTLALVNTSYNIAWSKSDKDNDYCYDQVGDGHFCFDSKKSVDMSRNMMK